MSYVPAEGSKLCRSCGRPLPVGDFPVFRKYGQQDREYRRPQCRGCRVAYVRAWRERNPTYASEASRRYRAL